MSTELILIIVAAVIGLYGIMLYNRLVSLRQNRKNAFSDIDVQLKQRFDLVPPLVEKALYDVLGARIQSKEEADE